MRIILLAAVSLLVCGSALAQGSAPPPGLPGRYAIAPAGEGFVRLDTQTGTVSHCERQQGQWLCEPAVESSGEIFSALTGLNHGLANLTEATGSLWEEIEALKRRADAIEATALRKSDAKLTASEEKELDQILGVSDQMMRRLYGLVAAIKRAEQRTR